MRDGDALALDHVHAERGRVEEDVADVVVEEVDLVDVEDSPVGLGEETRLEGHHALSQRTGDVDGAGDAVLGGVQRQVDDAHAPPVGAEPFAALDPLAAGGTGGRGVAREGAVGHDLDLRQELGEAADGGGLAGAARALDEDAADGGVDGVDQERLLEALLVDDGRERVQAHERTSGFPNVGSACGIGAKCHVPISGTAVSRLTLTSIT